MERKIFKKKSKEIKKWRKVIIIQKLNKEESKIDQNNHLKILERREVYWRNKNQTKWALKFKMLVKLQTKTYNLMKAIN